MRVVHLAAGAAGMYCGSCMHNSRLVGTLRAAGHDAVLVPLYTPLRTDETDVSEPRLYFGAINVFLQHAFALFRHTPWFLDRVFNARPLLNALSRFAGSTSPETLAEMTAATLRGEEGPQRKELDKLIAGLRPLKPDVVHLPNLLLCGLVRRLKAELDVTVLCALAGEDVFVDRFPEPHRTRVFELIRTRAADVDGFVSPTDYYARHATQHFGLPAERVQRLTMGIHAADFAGRPAPPEGPFTIGYLAHVNPAKGLANLGRALIELRRSGRDCRVRAAGYLGPADKAYLESIRDELDAAGCAGAFEYVGEVTREEKIDFLSTLHLFSVPTDYHESKGYFVLEALAAGVPVVQPDHGSFPELIEATGGGLLYEAHNSAALADTLARVMDDAELRHDLAARGQAVVQVAFTAEKMAAEAWELYERIARERECCAQHARPLP